MDYSRSSWHEKAIKVFKNCKIVFSVMSFVYSIITFTKKSHHSKKMKMLKKTYCSLSKSFINLNGIEKYLAL